MRAFWSFAGAVRHYPERLLHGARRSAARRSMAAVPVSSALFICHGNVCRSPFAAATFARDRRDKLGASVRVRSAGFVGPGRQPPAHALAAARRRDVDMTDHRSMLVTSEAVQEADLVVVMGADQAAALRRHFGRPRGAILVLGDLDPQPIVRRTIRDPWGGDDEAFDDSYARLERCIASLTDILASSARPTRS